MNAARGLCVVLLVLGMSGAAGSCSASPDPVAPSATSAPGATISTAEAPSPSTGTPIPSVTRSEATPAGNRVKPRTGPGADFDADGFDDLVIAERLGTLGAGDGVVHVLYGSKAGIKTRRSQLWSPIDFGGTDRGDSFGQGLASGDFDADGYPIWPSGTPAARSGFSTDRVRA